jgi:hypothetical protein
MLVGFGIHLIVLFCEIAWWTGVRWYLIPVNLPLDSAIRSVIKAPALRDVVHRRQQSPCGTDRRC